MLSNLHNDCASGINSTERLQKLLHAATAEIAQIQTRHLRRTNDELLVDELCHEAKIKVAEIIKITVVRNELTLQQNFELEVKKLLLCAKNRVTDLLRSASARAKHEVLVDVLRNDDETPSTAQLAYENAGCQDKEIGLCIENDAKNIIVQLFQILGDTIDDKNNIQGIQQTIYYQKRINKISEFCFKRALNLAKELEIVKNRIDRKSAKIEAAALRKAA